MAKFIVFLFVCFFCARDAAAYNFTKIQSWFALLEQTGADTSNVQTAALSSLENLKNIDSSLSFRHNGAKAFLYQNDNLIGIFELPKEQKQADLWRELVINVLQTGVERFDGLAGKEREAEDFILREFAARFDDFSRFDILPKAQFTTRYDETNRIIYLKPSLFYIGISQAIQKIVEAHSQADGIILDLRGCAGGNFNEALKTADLFLDTSLIAYSQDNHNQRKYYMATPGDIFQSKPITVLTDNATASAAELIAAALSEQSRAVLIGTKTFGKGSIQNTYTLKDQTLFLTSGHFYTPSGRPLDDYGLTPQICTGLDNSCTTPDKSDFQKDIKIAIRLIKNKLG